MTAQHPGATPYRDRHGRVRWRYRRKGRQQALPGAPGEPAFEAAYTAAVTGRPAPVLRLPGAAHPRSLAACWRIVTRSIEWQQLKPISRSHQIGIAERFLHSRVNETEPTVFGALPIDQLRRRHIKAILGRYADRPHAGADVLTLLRKLTGAALDEEWIETDPTFRVRFRPPYKGWKAWDARALAAFETRWPIGSTPRTVYALALLQGHRRGDLAALGWDASDGVGFAITQSKTGKALWIPILAELHAALAAAPRRGATILVTQYGRPFSVKALGMRMQAWTRAAGIAPGHTLHGLRKSLGKWLAERGATTRQIMAILGHDSLAHAELYTREADQRLLAEEGMKVLTFGARKPRGAP